MKIPSITSPKYRDFIIKNKKKFMEISRDVFTKDGLIKCNDVIFENNARARYFWYKHKTVALFPTIYSSPIIQYLIDKPLLWNNCAIRFTYTRSVHARAPMFGVPFEKAIRIVMEKGFIKSKFYLPKKNDYIYPSLLIYLNRRKESNNSMLELQAWLYIDGSAEVFYIHSESPDFINSVNHIDGAIMHCDQQEIHDIFINNKKIKCRDYQKQFRIDGSISVNEMIILIDVFFPLEELTQEAFSVEKLE